MIITTNIKGQIAASKAELRALELGYIPSKPIFDARYDMVLDNRKGDLLKIQIKYANGIPSSSTGAVVVKLAYENRVNKVFTYQQNEVDALVVYIPKIDKLCYFPQKIFLGKKRLHLRLEKSKNNQTQGIIYARDYLW